MKKNFQFNTLNKKKGITNIFEIDNAIIYSDKEADSQSDPNEIGNFYSDKIESEKTEFLGKSLTLKKINYFYIFIYFLLAILLAKSFILQIMQGNEYRIMAEKNRIRFNIIKTTRGLIYDRNGIVLVKNVPNFTLAIVPSELPINKKEKAELLQNIAKIANVDLTEINEKINKITLNSLYYYQPLTVKEDIKYEDAIKLNIYYSNTNAVKVFTDARREYQRSNPIKLKNFDSVEAKDSSNPQSNESGKRLLEKDVYTSMAPILGYVGKITEDELDIIKDKNYLLSDYIGKTGIEKFYENELKGTHGQERIEVDAYGREKKILSTQSMEIGNDIMLTIDINIQNKLEQILYTHLLKIGKTRAAAIALNPKNGEVIAMVSSPTFDNNDFAKGIAPEKYQQLIDDKDLPLFFRCIAGEYPSGSTFKLIMATAALQEGIINEYTTVLSTGGIRIGEWFFPDWNLGGHGVTDVKRALAQSINTFFYAIGGGYNNIEGLGVQKIAEYGKLFGLSEKLGIDLPNEASGFLPSKEWKEETKGEKWYIGDTYHLSIGQGDLLVTPLQVAQFTAIIANGGTFYKPHIVQKIYNPNTKQSIDIKPEIKNQQVADKKNIEIVQKGLRQAVTDGSARKLSDLQINIAGKTGTAQWHTEKDYHAWFTSYAPYEDPKIVLTILIEEGGGGDVTAVPIAKDFYEWWAEYTAR